MHCPRLHRAIVGAENFLRAEQTTEKPAAFSPLPASIWHFLSLQLHRFLLFQLRKPNHLWLFQARSLLLAQRKRAAKASAAV